ncbi:MAG: nitroreductase family protein [Phototrophicaceae bacterium]
MASPIKTQILKPAETDYPVLDVIKNRWSPRAFDTRLVEDDKLRSILEAARWAASSMNTQPWRFIIATRDNAADFQKMLGIIKEGNQAWAKNAPVLLLAVARDEHDGGYINNHAAHDTGQALAYLSLQATSFDLYIRMMGGFYPDKAREAYAIPDGYTPITALALGYLGSLEQLPEKLQDREQSPRNRKPLSELVFAGTWDNTAHIVK